MLNFYFQGSRPTLLHSIDNSPILLLMVSNQSRQKKDHCVSRQWEESVREIYFLLCSRGKPL